MSRQRKSAAVLRLLRGEDLETVSRELGVTAATLTGWRDSFLAAAGLQPTGLTRGEAALTARAVTGEELESERLKASDAPRLKASDAPRLKASDACVMPQFQLRRRSAEIGFDYQPMSKRSSRARRATQSLLWGRAEPALPLRRRRVSNRSQLFHRETGWRQAQSLRRRALCRCRGHLIVRSFAFPSLVSQPQFVGSPSVM